MGYGSAGTPPWVDEEKIDEEKKKRKEAQASTETTVLKQENAKLKKRIKQLEEELRKARKLSGSL